VQHTNTHIYSSRIQIWHDCPRSELKAASVYARYSMVQYCTMRIIIWDRGGASIITSTNCEFFLSGLLSTRFHPLCLSFSVYVCTISSVTERESSAANCWATNIYYWWGSSWCLTVLKVLLFWALRCPAPDVYMYIVENCWAANNSMLLVSYIAERQWSCRCVSGDQHSMAEADIYIYI